MGRRKLYTIALYGCSIVLIAAAMASFLSIGDSKRLYDGLVPLKQRITAREVRSSFVAVWNEPHEIIISFPYNSGIEEVDAFVEHAATLAGADRGRPVLDITWRVYQNGVLVGAGSGANGASGVSFGQHTRRFIFESFPVVKGKMYEVVVEIGPRFVPLLRASPAVEVGVAATAASVGLAFSESFDKWMAWGLCGFGVIVLFVALWYHHAGSIRNAQ